MIRVVAVCTANICRSPIAHGFLLSQAQMQRKELAITSAGFITEDRPAHNNSIEVMAERGIDISDHRSRRVTEELLDRADLVLGMARNHIRDVTVMHPPAFEKTFTLLEFVRKASLVGARPDGMDFADWRVELNIGREPRDYLRDDEADDIADPIGRSIRTFRRTAEQIEDQVEKAVKLL